MSRTDKTDPYWVHEARYGREEHDHSDGPCDLDATQGGRKFIWYKNGSTQYRHRCYRGLSYGDTRYINYNNTDVHEYANLYERSERRRIKHVLTHGNWDNDVLDYTPRNSAKWICG